MRKNRLYSLMFLLPSGMLSPIVAHSADVVLAENVIILPELTVEAEAEKNKGDVSIAAEALPAQVEIIDREEVESLPVGDYLDLFRRTPGVITGRLGQGDVADGFGLRGFVGDHGGDVAVFVDGVPLNVPNHAHNHGLADPNWVIPEMIERIEVIKGPFSALYGNFALGGVVNITTRSSDTSPKLGVEAGSYDTYRAVGTYSHDNGGVTPFLVYEGYDRQGYRDNSDLQRYNAFNKVTIPLAEGALSIRAHAVDREFGAPGYLAIDQVEAGLINRRAAVNDTDGGDSAYYNLVANYIPRQETGLHATLYAGADELNRFADFGLPGPPFTQRQDHSERDYAGWRVFYNLTWGTRAALTVGTDGEFDDGIYQRFLTDGRGNANIAPSRDRRVEQLSTGLFAQGQVQLVDKLKLVGGVRYDRFDIDVDNRITPANSGDSSPDIVSPKVGLVYSPTPRLELFANTGKGFRSPAASELSADPDFSVGQVATGFDTDLDPLELDSWDIGIKAQPLPGLILGADYYQTDTEAEIVVLGTDPVNVGSTEREGYELSIDYAVSEALNLYASHSSVDARVRETADADGTPIPSSDVVPGVPDDSQTLGITWRKRLPENMTLVVDGYAQRLGDVPLTVDRSIEGDAITRYGVKASLSKGHITGFLQALYHPQCDASEATFDFGDPVPRFDPKPELDVLAGIKYSFE